MDRGACVHGVTQPDTNEVTSALSHQISPKRQMINQRECC